MLQRFDFLENVFSLLFVENVFEIWRQFLSNFCLCFINLFSLLKIWTLFTQRRFDLKILLNRNLIQSLNQFLISLNLYYTWNNLWMSWFLLSCHYLINVNLLCKILDQISLCCCLLIRLRSLRLFLYLWKSILEIPLIFGVWFWKNELLFSERFILNFDRR